ncbi:acetoacetate--CoA ligase [Modestobacter italicus]|uniref:acetoacetate--CoA ligase n=1 Tax=Modestobacter italicus (strain DSM 44449 / CECT 9708 / BC 501) TaxID=2732864 RepID=UPI001C95ECC2|nr:acetoacetate--CoA ligase [Modestobacter italicus]
MSQTSLRPASSPPLPARPQVAEFRDVLARSTGRPLADALALHADSVAHLRDFWATFLSWSQLAWEGSAEEVCTSDDVESATFFPGVRLNYAENLLRPLAGVDDDRPALTALHADGGREQWTRRQLREAVADTATALAVLGLGAGGRAVVVGTNNGSTVIAALATAAVGASISSGMPDMGPTALLGRFTQVAPTVLLLDRTAAPAGWDGAPGDVLDQLLTGLPTAGTLLVLDDLPLPEVPDRRVQRLGDVLADLGPGTPRTPWPRLPFNDPLFVMFSSGTTGPPKAMVHGIGGTLLEHVKEHRLHGDLDARDTLYFHTTTAWMMWNWQLSALAVGARVVLYDGPVTGPETLWQLVADEGVTVFGTSPAQLQLSQDLGLRPGEEFSLHRLRAVLSTGSVLHDWQFDWFSEAVGPLPLQSISGGTDLVGCFVLGHPELPVVRGRSQSLSLGMDVAALDPAGRPVLGEAGELVCRTPFPSRPVHFLADPDGARLHAAYYAEHAGAWTHGDVVDLEADGTARVHGRSDGVLNIDGVRIGPSEVYRVLRTAVPQVAQAVAVEQRHPTVPGATRLVLLVQLRAGVVLDGPLERTIRDELRRQASPAHVPALVLAVPAVPMTHSGKVSEKAARDTVNGDRVANVEALRNPGSLTGITEAMAAADARQVAPAEPDHDPHTAAVRRLWRELGVVPHEGIDSFFDLGGTSRQSMTLLRRLRLELGAGVPMDQFLADPTIAGLAAAVRRAGADQPHVVQLAPGDPTAPPLFLLHDAWGDVDVYRPLAQRLTGVGPVYGVRARLTDADGRRRSIAELAAAAVTELSAVAPVGPVHLAGFSFGGLVAFEAARLLELQGRPVGFLGLLDVLPPRASMTSVRRWAHDLAGQLGAVVPGLADRPLREVLRQRFRPATRPVDRQALDHSEVVFDQHALQPYGGPVTYFLARRRIPVAGNLLSVWRAAAPRLTVVPVPGAHFDLLAVRHVEVLAARVSTAVSASR